MPTFTTSGGQEFTFGSPAAIHNSMCRRLDAMAVLKDSLWLKFFPTENAVDPMGNPATEIRYRFRNMYCGLQSWRGAGNQFPVVNYDRSMRECVLKPGYWGEKTLLKEEQLMRMVGTPGACNMPYSLNQYIGEDQEYLLIRQLSRQNLLAVQTMVFGKYFAMDSMTGQTVLEEQFNIIRTAPAVRWSDLNNSTPFRDLLNWKLQYQQQTLANWGRCAKLVVNPNTYAWLIQNSNTANWSLLGQGYCCYQKTLEEINQRLYDMDLPQIYVDNTRYVECKDNAALLPGQLPISQRYFLPDGYAVLVGCTDMPTFEHEGSTFPVVGNLWLTKNLTGDCSLQGYNGLFSQVKPYCERDVTELENKMGWNGAFALECPQSIISLWVG